MAVVRIVTEIVAPAERCFDLARDIDFHTKSLAHTGERAVAGRTSGLIELGESVTWEGRHLGVRQWLTVAITAFDRPRYFRDEMTAGAFRSFAHDHRFEERDGVTVMTDEVTFRSAFGPVGWLVDRLYLAGYLRRLLEGRCQAIKREAEAVSTPPPAPVAADKPPDKPPSFRRAGDLRRLAVALLMPWLLIGVAYLFVLAVWGLPAAGVEVKSFPPLLMLGFILIGGSALLWFPAAFLYGVWHLITRRGWRRSWYGWLWPLLVYADMGLFIVVVDHGPL